jgi:hypothetical protein
MNDSNDIVCLDRYNSHQWRYSGDEKQVIRKCAFCLIKQTIKGKWISNV